MILNGMNVARLNFSHGSLSEHKNGIDTIRTIAKNMNKPVAIIQDLSGSKVRVGTLSRESVTLEANEPFTLSINPLEGNEKSFSVSYPELPKHVIPGDTILLSDSEIELKVNHKVHGNVYCRVIVGGIFTPKKGINIPTRSLPGYNTITIYL